MFTGIIEELGEVVAIEPAGDSSRVTVAGRVVPGDATHGASIAVDGVCLTVTDPSPKGDRVTFDVIAEILRRSALGDLRVGDRVNLERAVVVGARLDGHLVQGHVDAVATITERRPEGHGREGEVGDDRPSPSPAEALRLRPAPPRVTRLSRKVLAGLGVAAGLGIGAALIFGLQGRDGGSAAGGGQHAGAAPLRRGPLRPDGFHPGGGGWLPGTCGAPPPL